MVACEWVDLLGTIFRLHEQGQSAEARRLHSLLLAGVNVEIAYGMAGAREVLRRRGIIRSTASRYSSPDELDPDAVSEIEAILAMLSEVLPRATAEPEASTGAG